MLAKFAFITVIKNFTLTKDIDKNLFSKISRLKKTFRNVFDQRNFLHSVLKAKSINNWIL